MKNNIRKSIFEKVFAQSLVDSKSGTFTKPFNLTSADIS